MFRWASFLDLAGGLAAQIGGEAAERSAISRAYYACFHEARDFLDRQGPRVPRDGSAHHVVWGRFRARPDMRSKRIAHAGQRLHAWRKHADYDDPYPAPDLSAEAQAAVALARQLVDDLAATT